MTCIDKVYWGSAEPMMGTRVVLNFELLDVVALHRFRGFGEYSYGHDIWLAQGHRSQDAMSLCRYVAGYNVWHMRGTPCIQPLYVTQHL